jgi:DNA polymerase III delta prime subunit
MSEESRDPSQGLRESVAQGRIHGAYLFSGAGDRPREAALEFVRALACVGASGTACEECPACRRSRPGEPVEIDGSGKSGPLLRHVGDHPDLVWVERGAGDTRVRIGQVRALQQAFRLRGMEGGRRAAVVADAEWLNQEAQNALLRILEEPPPRTTLILVTAQPSGLLATVRSRCQRIRFAADRASSPLDSDEAREIVAHLESLSRMGTPDLLDWAEEFRGPRAIAAASLTELLSVGTAWLHERTRERAAAGEPVDSRLAAWTTLQNCRKSLVQRNANPQMVAERALLALHEAVQ